MGFGDVWNKTLVYFGIAEEEDWDEDGYLTDEELPAGLRGPAERAPSRAAAQQPRGVRRLDRPGAERSGHAHERPAGRAPEPRRLRGVESAPATAGGGAARVHLVLPRSFNDAQQVADKFKEGVPVILNLQGCDQELSKRLIDFTSGLTYALDGAMQRVADKVFLLTPRNVEVSAEERARMLERGGFFNQA